MWLPEESMYVATAQAQQVTRLAISLNYVICAGGQIRCFLFFS